MWKKERTQQTSTGLIVKAKCYYFEEKA